MHESNRLQANQLRIAAANNCVAPNATPQSYKGARSQGTAPRRARSPPRETGNPQEGRETTTSYHNAWGVLLANPLSLGQPQAWEYPVSLFNGGMANGTLKHGLEMDLTQSLSETRGCRFGRSLHRLPSSILCSPQLEANNLVLQ